MKNKIIFTENGYQYYKNIQNELLVGNETSYSAKNRFLSPKAYEKEKFIPPGESNYHLRKNSMPTADYKNNVFLFKAIYHDSTKTLIKQMKSQDFTNDNSMNFSLENYAFPRNNKKYIKSKYGKAFTENNEENYAKIEEIAESKATRFLAFLEKKRNETLHTNRIVEDKLQMKKDNNEYI